MAVAAGVAGAVLAAGCGSKGGAGSGAGGVAGRAGTDRKLPQTGASTGASGGRAAGAAAAQKGGKIDPARFPRPKLVRGIYVTAWAAGGKKRLNDMMAKTKGTEINSFVIDVRDDGEMYFKTGIPLAKEAKAETIAVVKPELLMSRLKAAGIYPIARIACFRDHFVPKHDPTRAVNFDTGGVWHDRSGHTWLDPYDKRNWDYIAKTVEYALDQGFPEIQLDYVRFPSEGKAGNQRFPNKAKYPDAKASPSDVIAEFCKTITTRVRARGAVCGADVFGIISSGTKDQGIGQTLEEIAAPFDVLCPMVYPSHFAKGEYKIPNPNAAPYAIIKKSLGDTKRRVPKTAVRPWLQDFSLGVRYGEREVRAQIKAAHELGIDEYLMWNAGTRYTWSAYKGNPGGGNSGGGNAGGAGTPKPGAAPVSAGR